MTVDCEAQMKELVIDALTDNLNTVIDFVDEQLEAADCSMKTQMQINVAVEEIFVNIAHYAYAPDTGSATIRVAVDGDPAVARIMFLDSGVPYNPLEKTDPDVTSSLAERQIGGLGIYLVKKTMDQVLYEYSEGQNILTLEKKLK